jgi:hypothetical protein
MKHAKRFAAALLAVLMLAALLAVPGMAAVPGEPQGNARNTKVSTSIDASAKLLTETLTVSDYCYLPKITYTLTLGAGSLDLSTGFGSEDESSAYFSLDGFDLTTFEDKTLATVVFGDEYSGYYAQYTGREEGQWNLDNNNYRRNIVAPGNYELPYWLNAETVAAINALEFDRACVLWFPIYKTRTAEKDYYFGTDPTDDNLTNYNHNSTEDTGTALVIFVPGAANGPGTPVVGVYAIDENEDEPTFNIETATMGFPHDKITDYADEYNPEVKNLTIGKNVSGSLGDYDRYFRFDVTLYGFEEGFDNDMLQALLNHGNLVPDGANSVSTVTAAKYGNEKYDENWVVGFSNLDSEDYVTEVDQSNSVTFTFWLKNGETIMIQNIPDYVTSYYVEEIGGNDFFNPEGYSVSYVINKVVGGVDQLVEKGVTYEISNDSWDDTNDQTVTVTNERDVNTPTGVSLQVAAPIAGVVIALGLGAVVLLGRKRRRNGSF